MGKRMREDKKIKAEEVDSPRSLIKNIDLQPELFKVKLGHRQDDSLSVGGLVKANGQVLKEQSLFFCRPPNINCRIQSFGRICQKFDEKRTRWVTEMGLGGLLHFVADMQLPRQLAYWVMTRIDPINKRLIGPDGREFCFSKNQVQWILGIPNGCRSVPTTTTMDDEIRCKVQKVLIKYGKTWESRSGRGCGRVYSSLGIPVTTKMLDKLEAPFEDDEEEEFKSIFLIVALHLVLCPTQSPRLAADLLPALSCVMDCAEYDWCALVLKKLMDSVASFARRFYAAGYAGGCGGCAMFAVIFYLNRLDNEPVEWGVYPRIKVWAMKEIRRATKADRQRSGDFGRLGMIDVAYGERHCRLARDTQPPGGMIVHKDVTNMIVLPRGRRRCEGVGATRKETPICDRDNKRVKQKR